MGGTDKPAMQEGGSLARAVDEVNQAFFDGETLTYLRRRQMAADIARTIGKPGAYAGMFAPAAADFEPGVRTFTGEPLRSRAGIAHVLGEEACRGLILLGVTDSGIHAALAQATAGMLTRLKQSEDLGSGTGTYCCGTCSAAYWRHLAAGGLDRNEERLTAAMASLKESRAGGGGWGRFPFYYTLLALSEMDPGLARDEVRYAAPHLVRLIKRAPAGGTYAARRHRLLERILERS